VNQEWDDKYSPKDRRHAEAIRQRQRAVDKARERVKELCQ
jgi:hypothetical protein